MAQDLNNLIREAERQNWNVERRRRTGHLVFTSPDGHKIFTSGTPSDHRAHRNLVADLQRHGFVYDRGHGRKRLRGAKKATCR